MDFVKNQMENILKEAVAFGQLPYTDALANQTLFWERFMRSADRALALAELERREGKRKARKRGKS